MLQGRKTKVEFFTHLFVNPPLQKRQDRCFSDKKQKEYLQISQNFTIFVN